MKQTVVISPSGKFYGSEQVLYDYVCNSRLSAKVYLPNRGEFYQKLEPVLGENRLQLFASVKSLYLHLAWLCILGRIACVYINEGGHNKYGLLLAKWFPRLKVVIHLRILEDTQPQRWPAHLPSNVHLVTISRFLSQQVVFPHTQLYDPYPFADHPTQTHSGDAFRIGIIGRIGYSKGIEHLVKLLSTPNLHPLHPHWTFCFYGELTPEILQTPIPSFLQQHPMVQLMGFVSNKADMYEHIDCVLHAAKEEPLGRIFLEALDHGLPLVGFDAGGIGEIAHTVGYTDTLCPAHETGDKLLEPLERVYAQIQQQTSPWRKAKEKATSTFSIQSYCHGLDTLLQSHP